MGACWLADDSAWRGREGKEVREGVTADGVTIEGRIAEEERAAAERPGCCTSAPPSL